MAVLRKIAYYIKILMPLRPIRETEKKEIVSSPVFSDTGRAGELQKPRLAIIHPV
jgi:hypothetical protein